MTPRLTAERARELFDYNPDTGELIRRISAGTGAVRAAGAAAGTNGGHVYRRVGIDGQTFYVHRVVWLVVTGEWPPEQIDHVNEDKYDNRLANLRLATHPENRQNTSKPNSSNRIGLRGVSPDGRRFRAQIKIDGRARYLGRFDTVEEAHAAYLDAKRRLHPFWTAGVEAS